MRARNAIIIVGLGMIALAGCHSPVQQDVDSWVCNRARLPMDVSDFMVPSKEPPAATPPPKVKGNQKFIDRLQVPGGVPGTDAPNIRLPADFENLSPEKQKAALEKFFKSQMEVGPDPKPLPGPEGRPLTLADLQKLAREHSPLLPQAASDIDAADGGRIQAAVYYNPTFQYATTPVSFTSGNIVGPGITQTFSTMGKKKLAEEAARVDVESARQAYRRAETDLMANVRSNYFQVLVAEEGMRANRGLMQLTDQIYQVMLAQLRLGKVAPYEPAQIGVFAGQARIAYIQSRNSYLESWKLLATTIGLTTMPVTELAGSIASELPRFDFDKSLAHILNNHTDAVTARIQVDKARLQLRLQEVTWVPDPTFGLMAYDDNSTPGPPRFVPSFTMSVPVPVFDRNQGNIKSAQAALFRAVEQPHATQNVLTAAFADAYRRLEENRQILELYRKQLLPQQVQAYRSTVLRHFAIGEVENTYPGAATAYFGDLITSEQNLVTLIGNYLTTLSNYWQAVSDSASLLQIDDAYIMPQTVEQMRSFDLAELLKLPCCHPCSTLPGQAGKAGCCPTTGVGTLPASIPAQTVPARMTEPATDKTQPVLSKTRPHGIEAVVEAAPEQIPAARIGLQGMADREPETRTVSALSEPAVIRAPQSPRLGLDAVEDAEPLKEGVR